MAKILNDKYYTPLSLAKSCVDITCQVIGGENISEFVEPSAGAGVFLDCLDTLRVLDILDKPYLAFDIEPEDERITKQDWLTVELEYKKGRCIIGNPPFGSRLNTAQKFYKKAVLIADYIAFILPIGQLNNTQSMYEFDLIYSEDLGIQKYTDRELHCCFNIYRRPTTGVLNIKTQNKLKDISIFRQDSNGYTDKEFDLRICYWGNGSAGKILKDNEHYSAEYKIKINNSILKDEIISVLSTFDWKEYLNCIAMRKIQQFHIIDILQKRIPEIS